MPAAMKRPAAVKAADAKKVRVAEAPEIEAAPPTNEEVVAQAIRDADMPVSAKELLEGMLPFAFARPRHTMQEQVVVMTSAELAKVEKALKEVVIEHEQKVVTIDEERLALEAVVAAACTKAQEQATELVTLKAKKVSTQEALREAKVQIAAHAAKLAASVVQLAKATETKAQVDQAAQIKAELAQLVGEGAVKADIQAKSSDFAARIKEFITDRNLINAVQLSLGKPSASRGTFEQMVVRQFEEQSGKLLAEIQQESASAEDEKTKTQEALSLHEKALETAKLLHEEAQIVASNAEVSNIGAKEAMQEAKSGLKSFEQEEVGQRKSVLAVAQAALQKYQEGPLAALKALTVGQVELEGQAAQLTQL